MTFDAFDGTNFGREIVRAVKDHTANAIKRPLEDRLVALEARIEKLEARGELKYCGIWQQDHQYERGNFVTMNGGLWHAEMKTTSCPGSDSTWRLAVKSPRA
jgi:hypothetical protein